MESRRTCRYQSLPACFAEKMSPGLWDNGKACYPYFYFFTSFASWAPWKPSVLEGPVRKGPFEGNRKARSAREILLLRGKALPSCPCLFMHLASQSTLKRLHTKCSQLLYS